MKVFIIVILAALLVFLGFLFCVAHIMLKKSFGVRGAEPTGFLDYFFSQNPELKTEAFSTPTKSGAMLRGIHLIPREPAKGLIVLTHGFGRSIEHYLPEAKCFVDGGFRVLMFDGLGTGRSDGDMIRGLPQHIIDMSAVLDHVMTDNQLSSLPLFLYGHSWGAYAADTVSCMKRHPIQGIISVSACNNPITALRPSIVRRVGKASPLLSFAAWIHETLIFGRLESYTAAKGLKKLSCPILVFHSKDDVVVPFSMNFEQIRHSLSHRPNVQFIEMDGRNHNLTTPPAVDSRQRQLIKQLQSNPEAPDENVKELWTLQMQTDVCLLKKFVDFYSDCLDNSSI